MTNLIKYKEVLYIDESVVKEKSKTNRKGAKNLPFNVILSATGGSLRLEINYKVKIERRIWWLQ